MLMELLSVIRNCGRKLSAGNLVTQTVWINVFSTNYITCFLFKDIDVVRTVNNDITLSKIL